jgi:acyl-CoA synthetase (AMP-forming)/AMP-acid ligase II
VDLGSWRVAFNGSEPVRVATMRRFATRFEAANFSLDRFLPCYGLAEATLFVCGKHFDDRRDVISDDDRVRPSGVLGLTTSPVAVGCPRSEEAVVVAPQSAVVASDGEVGEVWLHGDHISPGYFAADPDIAATFSAHLPQLAGPRFFRTGDLGFRWRDRLFITGRLKDLIIVRGRNIHPHDVEQAATNCVHPLVARKRAIAFGACPLGVDAEVLVVAQEVARKPLAIDDLRAAVESVRAAVTNAIGVAPAHVVLTPPGALPVTTSGKPRRALARDLYESGELGAALSRKWESLGGTVEARKKRPFRRSLNKLYERP